MYSGGSALVSLDRDANIERALKATCGVLLRVMHGKTFLLHETVREYLFERSICPSKADLILAQSCMMYLTLSDWNFALDHSETTSDIRSAILEALYWFGIALEEDKFQPEEICFLQYASSNWFLHIDRATISQEILNQCTVYSLKPLPESFPTSKIKVLGDTEQLSNAIWMMLASFGSLDPIQAIRSGSITLLSAFFDLKPHMNSRPILSLVQQNKPTALGIMLENSSPDDLHALLPACQLGLRLASTEAHISVAQVLFKHGASVAEFWDSIGAKENFFCNLCGICEEPSDMLVDSVSDNGYFHKFVVWLCENDLLTTTNINRRQTHTWSTLLHWAMVAVNEACVRYLLSVEDIDSNVQNIHGDTPLHWLLYTLKGSQIFEILTIFDVINSSKAAEGFDTSVRNKAGKSFVDLLHERFPCCPQPDQLLGKSEVELNKRDHRGQTLLHLAIYYNQGTWLEWLLDHDTVALNTQDNSGSTPLHTAVLRQNVTAAKQLLKMEDIQANIANDAGETPLHTAISPGERWRWNTGFKAFETAKVLVSSSAVNITACDAAGKTPQETLLEHGYDRFPYIMQSKAKKVIRLLLQRLDRPNRISGGRHPHDLVKECAVLDAHVNVDWKASPSLVKHFLLALASEEYPATREEVVHVQ